LRATTQAREEARKELTMDKNIEQQFQAADVAVERAVERFLAEIEQMTGRWESVAPSYIVKRTLLRLCDSMTKLIDDPIIANIAGPAAVKLSNALLDYRDSLPSER
jgi:hypothetical protein